MANESKCLKCGAPLTPDARDGFCHKCLLGQALAADSVESVSGADAGPSPPPPRLTVRYFGDYELLDEIAHGGMGVVWRARQASLDRFVALKMIRAGELATEEEVKRFIREAQAAANLAHPNIVSIYEVGRHEGMHYFSMRLVEGESLAARMSKAECRMSNAEAAKLMATVARAVHHAHERGILHRDLKPGNILIDAQGEPHVTDFGLAKRVDMPSDLTRTEAVMGTPSYMSPEQAQGRNHDLTPASDIFSLGAVLYHLLTGRPPFLAATAWETLKAVVEREPVRPRALNRRVDRDLETICLKCLEKDPPRRYGSAEELAGDLDRWLKKEPIRARPSSAVNRTVKWARRNPAIAGLSAALVLTVVLGLTALLWPSASSDNPSPTGPAAFMVQPQDTTAAAGATATLGVVAVGEEPLRYQWRKDGANLINGGRIRGAMTATLSIDHLQEEDLGSYTVVLSNAQASVTSEAAGLLFRPPRFDWVRSMGGPGVAECKAIALDSRGDIYATGDFTGTAEFGNTSLTSRGDEDIWIAKYSPQGTLLWVRSVGGAGSEVGSGLAVHRLGDVYLSGYFSGTATFAGTELTSAGSNDIFVAKFDPNGLCLWARQAGGKNDDTSASLVVDDDGGCSFTGRFKGTARFGPEEITSAGGGGDFYLARYDANGTFEWVAQGGGVQGDEGSSLAADHAGNCYVTGYVDATSRFGDVTLAGAKDDRYAFVAKYTKAGHLLWAVQGDRLHIRQQGKGIATDAAGNAIVVGLAGYTGDLIKTLFVAKFDASGKRQWLKKSSGNYEYGTWGVATDPAGNCLVLGASKGTATFGNTKLSGAAPRDTFIANFSPQGSLRWIQRTEGTGSSSGKSMAVGSNGDLYVAGTLEGTENFGPHRLTSRGKRAVFITKLVDGPPTQQAADILRANHELPVRAQRAQDEADKRADQKTQEAASVLDANHDLLLRQAFGDTNNALGPVLLKALEAAISRQPTSFLFWQAKATVLGRTNRQAEAVDALSSAINLAGSDGTAPQKTLIEMLLNRARLHRHMGRGAEADQDYAQAGMIQCQRKGIPLRDPQLQPGLLDLSAYYDLDMDSALWDWGVLPEKPRDSEASMALAAEVRRRTGVQFDVRGQVSFYRKASPYRESATGIPVNQRFTRLHMLHLACLVERDGTKIAACVLNYADGQTEELPIIYGEDIRTAQDYRPTTRAVVAWSGLAARPDPVQYKKPRIHQVTYLNPRPFLEVKSLDLASAKSGSSLYLIALTVEQAKPDEPEFWIAEARELENQGNRAGATAVFEQGLEKLAGNPVLWNAKAGMSERAGRTNEALQAFSNAIEFASADTNAFGSLLTDARLNRASLLRQMNRIEEAIADNLAACGIPPRSPQAGPEQIDLGLVYNRELLSYHSIPKDSAAANTMPEDVRKVTGVAFDLRGLVRLAGTNWVQLGHSPAPQTANGIPVGRAFARMHVVHSTSKAETDGVAIGAYVLHYADGQQQALPIIYGEHLRERDSPAKPEMRAPNSAVVCWSYRRDSWWPRLYATTYENPRPKVAVKSIDFVSTLTKSGPFLIAITVEP